MTDTALAPPTDTEQPWLAAPDTAERILKQLVASIPGGGEPRPGQVVMARQAAAAIETVTHCSVQAGTGTGKALWVDTPIPVPGGWTTMGELAPGDVVFDDQGLPTEVLAVSDVWDDHDCYEVAFSDGSSIVADAEHLWVASTAKTRKSEGRRGSDRNPDEAARYQRLHMRLLDLARSADDSEATCWELADEIGADSPHGETIRNVLVASSVPYCNRQPTGGRRPGFHFRRDQAFATLATYWDEPPMQKRNGNPPLPGEVTLTTAEMAETQVGYDGRKNLAIRLAPAVEHPHRDLPLDPYVFGVWLGDGSSGVSGFTTADPEIVIEIEGRGYTCPKAGAKYLYGLRLPGAPRRHDDNVTARLRSLDVLSNKHIPVQYLTSSIAQRRDLLAGLLDTDGTVDRSGAIQFDNTNQALIEGVRELVASLGYRASCWEGRSRLNGKDCGPKWTVQFKTDDSVFLLPRKQIVHKERNRKFTPSRNDRRYVTSVTRVAPVPVRCITVAAPSHLFLAGRSYIPTHNSLGALSAAIAGQRRTVIATSSKALQDQYSQKDLPMVQAVLAKTHPFSWAMLKGRGNYACLSRLDEARRALGGVQDALFDTAELTDDAHEPTDAPADVAVQEIKSILDWVDTTVSGDLGELDFEPGWETLKWVTTGPESCPGADKCPNGADCFAEAAITRAREADIVLVNTALLGADLVYDGAVLGGADCYIVDEAHDAEDVLAQAFGATITPGKLRLLSGFVKSGCSGASKEAGTLLTVADQLEQVLREHSGQSFRDGLDDKHPVGRMVTEVMRAVGAAQRAAKSASDSTRKVQAMHIRAERARKLADTIFMALARIDDDRPGDAIWIEDDGRELKRIPVQVGGLLASRAWKDKAVVFTSATFPSEMARRLGFDKDAGYFDVGSPFNHKEAAWLYVPPLLGQHPAKDRTPNHRDWFEEAWAESKILIKAAEGRTMLLCTSRRNTDAFAERARTELDYPVLVQGEMPKPKLIAEFAADPHSVCIGTLGLWQGVDVPGESLSCVILDKVPFPRPDDPLWQARVDHMKKLLLDSGIDERGADFQAFLKVNVPRAAAMLAQGAGRLVRKGTDKGLICVLDPRLAEKSYRKQILDAMPPMGRTRTRADAVGHLMRAIEAQTSVA